MLVGGTLVGRRRRRAWRAPSGQLSGFGSMSAISPKLSFGHSSDDGVGGSSFPGAAMALKEIIGASGGAGADVAVGGGGITI